MRSLLIACFLTFTPALARVPAGDASPSWTHVRIKATMYDSAESAPRKPLFKFDAGRRARPERSELEYWTRYSELDGKPRLEETTLLREGKVVEYTQKVWGEHEETGRLRVEGSKWLFEFTRAGKARKDAEDADGDVPVVAGPAIIHLLRENLEGLRDGKDVFFRYPVMDRMETFGFKLERVSHDASTKELVVSLKPTSWLVKPFVPLYEMSVDSGDRKLKSILGRSPVPRLIDGKWKEFQSLTVIEEFSEEPAI